MLQFGPCGANVAPNPYRENDTAPPVAFGLFPVVVFFLEGGLSNVASWGAAPPPPPKKKTYDTRRGAIRAAKGAEMSTARSA